MSNTTNDTTNTRGDFIQAIDEAFASNAINPCVYDEIMQEIKTRQEEVAGIE